MLYRKWSINLEIRYFNDMLFEFVKLITVLYVQFKLPGSYRLFIRLDVSKNVSLSDNFR